MTTEESILKEVDEIYPEDSNLDKAKRSAYITAATKYAARISELEEALRKIMKGCNWEGNWMDDLTYNEIQSIATDALNHHQ